jgi:hypothetical protein
VRWDTKTSLVRFLYSAKIGYSVDRVVLWVSLRGRTGTWAALLAVAAASCTLDRAPEFSGNRRAPGIPIIPTRSASSAMGLGPNAAQQPMVSAEMSGVICAGLQCPYTMAPVTSCCTTQNDVDRGAARFLERCGERYSATGDPRYGSACWQRDQLGLIDATCETANIDETGCCTDQGLCGTRNNSDKIGCHYALDEAPYPCKDAVNPPTGMNAGSGGDKECEPTGVFAVRASVDVSWGGRSGGLVGITDDGRGPILVHLLVRVESVSATRELSGSIKPCGVTLPAFYSTTLCESYNPKFPVEMWESPKMPTFPLLGRYSCYQPGCALTLDAQTTLLGIALTNPEAPWPTPMETGKLKCMLGEGEDCFPDHDNDSLPGLSIKLNTEGKPAPGVGCMGSYDYQAAPLNADPTVIFKQVRRAGTVLIGVRNKMGGSGKISADCNSGLGDGVAEFFESRAWGCVVKEGSANLGGMPAGPNEPCNQNEAQFMDENLPIYHVLGPGETPASNLNVTNKTASTGPQFSMVRLGKLSDDVSCDQVRNAAYP